MNKILGNLMLGVVWFGLLLIVGYAIGALIGVVVKDFLCN